jgi:hypothetical protein
MSAAERIRLYLEQRAATGNVRERIASPLLYPDLSTQDLTLADLQEVTEIAADLEKHERDIKAAAWDECAAWVFEPGKPDWRKDNPYRD